jgi:hypothetical protein
MPAAMKAGATVKQTILIPRLDTAQLSKLIVPRITRHTLPC